MGSSHHLDDSWDHLTESDLEMTIQSGGFVYRLFVCERKNQVKNPLINKLENPGQEVLLRLFGGKLLNKFSSDEIFPLSEK